MRVLVAVAALVAGLLILRSFMDGRMAVTPSAPGDKAMIIDLNPALYQYQSSSSITGAGR